MLFKKLGFKERRKSRKRVRESDEGGGGCKKEKGDNRKAEDGSLYIWTNITGQL